MGAEKEVRITVAEQVSRALAHPEANAVFPALLPSGKRHVLIALPTDTCKDLLRRVKVFRGPVNVAVGTEGGGSSFEVIVFWPAAVEGAEDPVDDCPVGDTSEVGMLVVLLRRTGKITRVQVAKPQYAELIDRETPELAGT